MFSSGFTRIMSLRVTLNCSEPAYWTHCKECIVIPSLPPEPDLLWKVIRESVESSCILLLHGFVAFHHWHLAPHSGARLMCYLFLSAFRSDLKFMISGEVLSWYPESHRDGLPLHTMHLFLKCLQWLESLFLSVFWPWVHGLEMVFSCPLCYS